MDEKCGYTLTNLVSSGSDILNLDLIGPIKMSRGFEPISFMEYKLLVTIHQITFLQQIQDVYCVVSFAGTKFKTKVAKHLHPQFEEDFVFPYKSISDDSISNEILDISVFKKEKDVLIGFAMIRGDSIELDRGTIFVEDIYEYPTQYYTSALHFKAKLERVTKPVENSKGGFLKRIASFTLKSSSPNRPQDKLFMEGKKRHIFDRKTHYPFKFDIQENDIEFMTCIRILNHFKVWEKRGIFRVTSSSHKIQEGIVLLHDIMQGSEVQFKDPYLVCNILREYLAWTSHPLLDPRKYTKFVAISKVNDIQERVKKWREILPTLPCSSTLGILLDFLNKIHFNAKVNGVNAMSLSLLFSWDICGGENNTGQDSILSDYKSDIVILEDLILLYSNLKDVWKEEVPIVKPGDITKDELNDLDELRDLLM
jgi:hypothetical protein